MKEQWKDIKGFEGKYQISNLGRVKSLGRNIGYGAGYWQNEKILSPLPDKDGYQQVSFSIGNRKARNFKVHKLVVMAFVQSDLPSGYHIRHLDGDILNNSVSNLLVGDIGSNTLDKYRHGTTKLSEEQTKSIRALGGLLSQSKIAEMYGVQQPCISRIINRKRGIFIK